MLAQACIACAQHICLGLNLPRAQSVQRIDSLNFDIAQH